MAKFSTFLRLLIWFGCACFLLAIPLQAQVVINEVMFAPVGDLETNHMFSRCQSSPHFPREWVELYNSSPCDTVDIGCWILYANTGLVPFTCGLGEGTAQDINYGVVVIPAGTRLPPGGFYTIGGLTQRGAPNLELSRMALGRDFCADLRWFLKNNRGWVGLLDRNLQPVDGVYWGNATTDDNASIITRNDEQLNRDFGTTTSTACNCQRTQRVLPSARQLHQQGVLSYAGNFRTAMGEPGNENRAQLSRVPDGGPWQNRPDLDASPGDCNGPCNTPPDLVRLSPAERTLCLGQALQLQASPNPGIDAARLSYRWTSDLPGFNPPPATQSLIELRPTQAGRFRVIVETRQGSCIDRDTATLIVRNIPGTQFRVSPDPVCLGEEARLELIGPAEAGADYRWTLPDGSRRTGAGPHLFPAPRPGTLEVALVVDNQGCRSDSTIRRFTVIDRPTADFSVEPAIVCTGQAVRVTFRGRATANAGFEWDFGTATATPGTGRGPHDLRWTSPGTQTIRLIVREGTACPAVPVERTVEVRRTYPSDFRVEPERACAGSPITLTYLGPVEGNAVFRWDFGGATVEGSGQGAGPHVLRWTTPGRKTLRLTVDAPTCPGETTTREIVVDPGLPVSLSLSEPRICTGQPVVLSCDLDNAPNRQFDWDFAGAEVRNLGGPNGPFELRWNSPGVRRLRLRVSDSGSGCPPGEAEVEIRVDPQPRAGLLAQPSEICQGESLRLTYTGDLLPDLDLNWEFDGAEVGFVSETPPAYDLRWNQPGTYRLRVVPRTPNCTGEAAEAVVTVLPQALAAIEADRLRLCADEELTIRFTGRAAPQARYTWDFGGARAQPGTGPGPHRLRWPAETDGIRRVRLQIEDAFTDRCPAQPAELDIEVVRRPVADLALSPADPLCSDDTLTVRFTGSPLDELVYRWDFGGAWVDPGTGAGPHRLVFGRAGRSTVGLTVERKGCISNRAEAARELLQAPDARFTLEPETLCVGGRASVRMLNATSPAATVRWFWGGLTAYVQDSTPAGLTFDGLGPGRYPIRLEISIGRCTGRRADTLHVIDRPAVRIDGPASVCVGGTLDYRALGTYEPYARLRWRSTLGTVSGFDTLASCSVRYEEKGRDTLYLEIENLPGCASEARLAVAVNEAPELNLRVMPDPACVGDTVEIRNETAIPAGADVRWQAPTGAVVLPDSAGLRVVWQGPGIFQAGLTVSVAGCPPVEASVSATVRNRPEARFTLEPRRLCPDETAIQRFSGQAGPAAEFDWGDLGGASAFEPIAGPGHRLRWSAAGRFVLSLTVRDSGCVSLPYVDSLEVGPRPTLRLRVEPPVTCPGVPVTARAESEGGEVFRWDFGGGVAEPGDSTAGPHALSWPTAGTYPVSVQAVAGSCSSAVERAEVRVVVPVVDFRIDSVACVGEDVIAELLTPFIEGGRYVWDWDVVPASVRQVRPGRWAVRWAGAGQRQVRLRFELAGCTSAEVSREVSVYPVPAARFTSSPRRGLVPLRVQFTNETTPPDVRHRWDFGDGQTGNARNPFHLYRRPGTYIVEYEAFTVGECRSQWRDTIVVEPMALFIPNAFTPNGDGVNDRFEILNLQGLDWFELLIFDRWGVLVFESKSPAEVWDGTKDGVPVPEGVYVWRLTLQEAGRQGQQVRVGSVTVIR